MRVIGSLTGAVLRSAGEYDVAHETVLAPGQVVKLAEGLVVPAAAGETGAILGVTAEGHSGKEDPLDSRAAGEKVRVYDDPMVELACPAPALAVAEGAGTSLSLVCAAAYEANAFQGGHVKGADGAVRRITASAAVADGKLALTVEDGAAPAVGELVQIFPPVGFAGGNLTGDGTGLTLEATAQLPLQVVGREEETGLVRLAAVKHSLAVGR